MKRPSLGVCGASTADPALAALAERLGAAAWRAGFDLVCGGLSGVMEATARGYAAARGSGSGVVIGILPGTDPRAANPHCDVIIPTGMGFARNALVVLAADGVVLCGGGTGTLSEAALAWQYGRPVCALRLSGGWAAELCDRTLDHRRSDRVEGFDDPADAVAYVQDAVARGC